MTDRPYRLSPPARTDLSNIRWWIEDRSGQERAREMIERLFDHFDLLAATPQLGPARDDLGLDRRSFTVRPFLIIYRPTSPQIEIDRIIPGARDLRTVIRHESPT